MLKIGADERGSVVIESVFGIFVLMFLAVGTIQVALTLYARNVLQAAVHDGARAAIEIGAARSAPEVIARRVITESAGGLVHELEVGATADRTRDRLVVRVVATGRLSAPGPIPVDLPVTIESTSAREIIDVQW